MEGRQPQSTASWPLSLFARASQGTAGAASGSSGARSHTGGAAAGQGADLEETMPLVIDIGRSSSRSSSRRSSSSGLHQADPRLPAPALSRDTTSPSTDRQTSRELPAAADSNGGSSSTATTISATMAAVAAELTGQGPMSRALMLQRQASTAGAGNSSSDASSSSGSRHAGASTSSAAAGQPGPEIAAAGGDETAAAAAERHRLSNPPAIDLASLAAWLEQLLPFACLLAVVFLWHHWLSVLVAAWLTGALIKANQTVRSQVAQKKELALGELSSSLLYMATNAAGVIWLTSSVRLWRSFVLLPPEGPLTVWQTFFLVFSCDCLIRLIGVSVKLLVVAAHQMPGKGPAWLRLGSSAAPAPVAAPAASAVPAAAAPGAAGTAGEGSSIVVSSPKVHLRQARALTFVEYALAGYRALVPTPIWYSYLLTSTLSSLLCSLLIGVYLTLKAFALMKAGRLLARAANLLMGHGALYGSYVDKEELVEGGDVCPICQDSITTPIRLECNTAHVFCEDCISEWLERDQSCPMCRAKPAGPGLQIHSDGGTTMLPQLF